MNAKKKNDGKKKAYFYPPSRKTMGVSPWMKAKSFLLRRDFSPDEARGEDTPSVSLWEIHRGFTLIETILVIAIIVIIASAGTPFYARFVAQNDLETSSNKLVSTIRKSQTYAMDGKDNATWGFCMSGVSLRLFRGTCASPSYNEDFDLSRVAVSGISETTFSGLTGKRGEPSNALNITISNSIGSKNFVLNMAGGLEIN